MLEAALALARADKFNLPIETVEKLLLDFLDQRDIEIRDPPPSMDATRLALEAAHRYRSSKWGLNLPDCLHYACAKFQRMPILATDGEFGSTDLDAASPEARP